MNTSLAVAFWPPVPHGPNKAYARRTADHSRPIRHGAPALTLIFAAVALVLGLAAVTASLAPFDRETGEAPQHLQQRSRAGLVRAVASAVPARVAGQTPVQPLALPRDPAEAPRPAFPPGSAGGPWTSPPDPQIGATPWDRLQASSPGDRRAFLLGAAIQLHAPEAAATPVPRRTLPSKEG